MRYYKMADRLFGTFFGLATNMFWKKNETTETAKTNDTIAQDKLTLQSIILECSARCLFKVSILCLLGS